MTKVRTLTKRLSTKHEPARAKRARRREQLRGEEYVFRAIIDAPRVEAASANLADNLWLGVLLAMPFPKHEMTRSVRQRFLRSLVPTQAASPAKPASPSSSPP